jgi:hypothetical protein
MYVQGQKSPTQQETRMAGKAGVGKAVIAVARSENQKLGGVSVTMAAIASCGDCPLRNNGCYAQDGHVGMMTRRMDAHVREAGLSQQDIADAEALAIDGIWSGLPLRIHVSGDCDSNETAQTVSGAADRYSKRNGQPTWTYTHSWRKVARKSWGQVSVLASCETPDEAVEARAQGYAPAIVVDAFPDGKKAWDLGNGLKAMPCPEQSGAALSCVDCKLCWNDEKLQKRNLAIAFAIHGSGAKKARTVLNVLNS